MGMGCLEYKNKTNTQYDYTFCCTSAFALERVSLSSEITGLLGKG
jgi:hypothetical protein